LRTNVLVDCGPPGFGGRIVAQMEALGEQRIDSLLITSAAEERIGGCPDVLRQMRVQDVGITRQKTDSAAMTRLHAALASWSASQGRAAEPWGLAEGQVLPWSKTVQAVVLNPPADQTDLDQNDGSAVLAVNYASWGVLLAGDIHAAGLARVPDAYSGYLRQHPVHVLKVPDHGSINGTSPEFLARLFGSSDPYAPRYAVLTNGSFDWSPRPDRQVVQLLRDRVEVLSTAQRGTVTFVIDPDTGPSYITEH